MDDLERATRIIALFSGESLTSNEQLSDREKMLAKEMAREFKIIREENTEFIFTDIKNGTTNLFRTLKTEGRGSNTINKIREKQCPVSLSYFQALIIHLAYSLLLVASFCGGYFFRVGV